MELQEFLSRYPRPALAFSGGVDSAYLLYEAVQCGADVRPYFVKSPFQPQFELNDALRLARQLQAPLRVLDLDVLANPHIASNPPDRCYFCKHAIFSTITQAAAKDGCSTLFDGTNASDDDGDRPGTRALGELHVLSPLRLCGLTKDEIRSRSKDAGLFTWDKPAYACLATRIPTGTQITAGALETVEQAENYLFSLGFTDFRVRVMDGCARLQVPAGQLPLALDKRKEIVAKLKQSYRGVLLDLEARSDPFS